ncbi:MAG TPA: hypothetical protein VGJ91_07590 [Polyangiaceae bacterium]|jgi:hypothetical protein
MRVPQLVSDFFEWRWAPCVGLTAGSLAFVALALLLIPARLDGGPHENTTLSSFDTPRPARALYASSLVRSPAEPDTRELNEVRVAQAQHVSAPQNSEPRPAPQRGFSPILERPEPPAPAPAPPAPAPAPGTTIVTQPEPGGPAREVTVQ